HLFGGHLRTSTLVLILVFAAVWWAYDTYRPEPENVQTPQVVPPGFIPDPNYTWVPRTRLQQPPVTVTETVTPTPTTTEPTTSEVSPPPLFPFPLPAPPPPTPAPPPGEPPPPPGAPPAPPPTTRPSPP
ncbi:MAG TPA: hypothetical protein VFQ37_09960, partial [Mycobacterium sp.]|nr:hypothetical protein [Mycobacterium sp.]